MRSVKPGVEKVIFWSLLGLMLAAWPLSTIIPLLKPEITPTQKKISALQSAGADVQYRGQGPARQMIVDLSKGKTNDEVLGHLRGLEVHALSLAYTDVTDAGLEYLHDDVLSRSLRTLDLANTKVADAGLVNLHGLSQLQTLDLTGTKVTDQGVAELQKARPNLRIVQR
jgi:Leucine Rich repeat